MATASKYDFKPYAYGFQKDSPFLAMFNYYINEMKEKGSLQQIQAKYEPPPQLCPDYRWKISKKGVRLLLPLKLCSFQLLTIK